MIEPGVGPGLLKAAAAALAFGLFSIWIAVEYRDGANLGGALLLRLVGTLPMLAIVWRHRRHLQALLRNRSSLAALVVTQALTATAYVAALELAPTADVVTVVYAYPALTFLGAVLLGWVAPSARAAVAVITCFAGVAIAVGGPSGGADPLGLALAGGAAVAYAVALLLTQRLLVEGDALLLASLVSLSAGLLQVCAVSVVEPPVLPDGLEGWSAGLATGLVSTTFGYVVLYSAIGSIGASIASVVLSLELVTALAGAAVILGDPIGAHTVVGAALIFLAVVLVGRSRRPRIGEIVP